MNTRRPFAEWGAEEFADLVRKKKRWKTASTLEELNSRIAKGKACMLSGKNTKGTIDVFVKFPELFLDKETVEDIEAIYTGKFTYMNGNCDTQKDKFFTVVENLHRAANILYMYVLGDLRQEEKEVKEEKTKKDLEAGLPPDMFLIPEQSAATLFDGDFDDEEFLEDKGKEGKTMTKRYKYINSTLRREFGGDETPIRGFAPPTSEGEKFIERLESKGVTTVGQFVSLDKLILKNLQSETTYRNDSSFQIVRQGVLDYINEKIAGRAETEQASVVRKGGTRAERHALGELEKEELKEKEIFTRIESYSAKSFVKGSEEMKKIHKEFSTFLEEVSEPYIDAGFTVDEIEAEIDKKNEKFHKIIDRKRAEYEEELKRAEEEAKKEAVRAAVRKKIEDDSNYHHDKNAFSQTDLERGVHKHFRDNDRNL